MGRGIPLGDENKISRPSAGLMITMTEFKFKNY